MAFRTLVLFCATAVAAMCAGRDFMNRQMFSADALRKGFATAEKAPRLEVQPRRNIGPEVQTCSIPLLEKRAGNPDPESVIPRPPSKRGMPMPKLHIDDGIAGPNPAPACKNWDTGR